MLNREFGIRKRTRLQSRAGRCCRRIGFRCHRLQRLRLEGRVRIIHTIQGCSFCLFSFYSPFICCKFTDVHICYHCPCERHHFCDEGCPARSLQGLCRWYNHRHHLRLPCLSPLRSVRAENRFRVFYPLLHNKQLRSVFVTYIFIISALFYYFLLFIYY